MQQRNSGNRRPTGTDGSDFSYRMVVDNRYTKVAKGKSTLSKVLVIQIAVRVGTLSILSGISLRGSFRCSVHAVVLLVGVIDMFFTYLKKEPLETLVVVSSSITVISIIVGELGRKRSRVNFLKFYMFASSMGILGLISSVIRSNILLKIIHDPSNWETEKDALLRIACVTIGLFVQIYSITTTTSLIRNMSPPKRAS